jgi:hypothetical protein
MHKRFHLGGISNNKPTYQRIDRGKVFSAGWVPAIIIIT